MTLIILKEVWSPLMRLNLYIANQWKSKLSCPFVVTTKESTIEIKAEKCQHSFNCNHRGGDTQLVLHAILASQVIIVICKDMNVLIFLVWAYGKFDIRHKWFMKYYSNNYADIKTICGFLGLYCCLPFTH